MADGALRASPVDALVLRVTGLMHERLVAQFAEESFPAGRDISRSRRSLECLRCCRREAAVEMQGFPGRFSFSGTKIMCLYLWKRVGK